MPKVNLTGKPTSEQVRIVRDYLDRRIQHQDQGPVKLSQVIKRFKHKGLINDKEKAAHFRKILRIAEKNNPSKGTDERNIVNPA
jgi:SOS response regulatory protein OraA/RecX